MSGYYLAEPEVTGLTQRQAAKAKRRMELLRAAAKIMADKGFHAMRLEDLGEAAGISGPAVYRYFSSKEEILTDLSPTLESYVGLLQQGDIWNWYLSSFVTSVITAALTLLFASMAAFALSRLQFRGRAAIYLLIIMGLMIPSQVLIVPLFQELRVMQLLNTYWAVILPQVPSVIAVFIFKQFFDGIPKELEEAARVDGAGLWRIYWGVIMPLSRPVTAAVAILTFVWTWNNLLLPLFVLSNPNLMTIPVGLATVQGSFGLRYADIQAGAILAALPLVVLYMFFQRQIVVGVTGSGLKG